MSLHRQIMFVTSFQPSARYTSTGVKYLLFSSVLEGVWKLLLSSLILSNLNFRLFVKAFEIQAYRKLHINISRHSSELYIAFLPLKQKAIC